MFSFLQNKHTNFEDCWHGCEEQGAPEAAAVGEEAAPECKARW